jgi:hypothetical protein
VKLEKSCLVGSAPGSAARSSGGTYFRRSVSANAFVVVVVAIACECDGQLSRRGRAQVGRRRPSGRVQSVRLELPSGARSARNLVHPDLATSLPANVSPGGRRACQATKYASHSQRRPKLIGRKSFNFATTMTRSLVFVFLAKYQFLMELLEKCWRLAIFLLNVGQKIC